MGPEIVGVRRVEGFAADGDDGGEAVGKEGFVLVGQNESGVAEGQRGGVGGESFHQVGGEQDDLLAAVDLRFLAVEQAEETDQGREGEEEQRRGDDGLKQHEAATAGWLGADVASHSQVSASCSIMTIKGRR